MQHWHFPKPSGEERESLGAWGGVPSERFSDHSISFSSNPRWSFMTRRQVYSSGMVLCFAFLRHLTKMRDDWLIVIFWLMTHTQSTGQEQQKGRGRECIKYYLRGPPHGSESDLCTPRFDGNSSGSCLPLPRKNRSFH